MAGINSTGNPNTDDYNLGRGIVYFSKLATSGFPDADGYRDLGNCPQFNISMDVQDLEHFSSRSGLKVLDKTFVISQAVKIAFQLDELNYQNLALFFSGATATYDNGHDTVVADVDVTASVVQGRWYDLYNSATLATRRRVYNLGATGCVFNFDKDVAGVDTLLVEGTDYVVDRVMGRVQIVSGSATCPAGSKLQFSISTAATTPKDLDEVQGLTVGLIEGALKFISENPGASNVKEEYQFHKVQIRADGDLPKIGDEVEVAGFSGTALVNNSILEASKVMTIRTYSPQ